ncbi:retrovirus-related Pol polyprotein from transposon 17.6 [Trichonephila clavipes]|nr:retrovirus-related Pol polyprotein from transposon 17.6 [Trichonephila clavipes]
MNSLLKPLLETIIETRVQAERDEKEENYYKRKQEGLILELERMKLSMTATSTNTSAAAAEKININTSYPDLWKILIFPPILKYLKGRFGSYRCLRKELRRKLKNTSWISGGDIKSSSELVQKLDDYEVARERWVRQKKNQENHLRDDIRNLKAEILSVLLWMWKPGYIKVKMPDCNPSKGDPAHFGILRINSLSPSNRNAVLRISINEVSGTAFADSGASHSIAGETLYTILLQQGAAFEKTVISLSFADGIVTRKEVLHAFQTVILEGKSKELLKKELDSLLQQGIIIECESPYASPVVLIPKPNGSMRLCIGYRKLNAQTVP